MRARASSPRVAMIPGFVFAAAMAYAGSAPLTAQEDNALGRDVYDRWCASCHGYEGLGDGYAAEYMLPRPRDFTQALYQIRTTPSGQLPTDDDIMRVINEGMPGTTMPGWEEELSLEERLALVDYLKSLSRFFATGEAPEPMTFSSPTRATEEALADGREVYELIECNRCHGAEGRGDGTSSPTLVDDTGMPIYSVDLTENWYFNGGGTVEDIYRRLRTGLDGTPMPSFTDLIDAGVITDEQLWNLSHYVRSFAPEDPPGITEVIRAGLVEDAPLPQGVDDPMWESAEAFYIPMGGQIIQSPRWFVPQVAGLWVRAMHDGDELAVHVSWSDHSESPDTAWADFQARVLSAVGPDEGDMEPGPRPDGLNVQFPMEIPEGMDKPYFLLGDPLEPVYLWHWESTAGAAQEADARGLGTMAPQGDASQSLASEAAFSAGRWAVMFRRALETEDPGDLQFRVGEPVPVGFAAWDGDNGESGSRSSISSWHYIFLQEPTPATVVVAPLIATLLTAGLGVLVVARAQRRVREGAEGADEGNA